LANFIPPMNGASLGSTFFMQAWFNVNYLF
jgi:hypothetical protein